MFTKILKNALDSKSKSSFGHCCKYNTVVLVRRHGPLFLPVVINPNPLYNREVWENMTPCLRKMIFSRPKIKLLINKIFYYLNNLIRFLIVNKIRSVFVSERGQGWLKVKNRVSPVQTSHIKSHFNDYLASDFYICDRDPRTGTLTDQVDDIEIKW